MVRFSGKVLSLIFLALAHPGAAFEQLDLFAIGASEDLRRSLARASILAETKRDGVDDPTTVLAAARAEYGRLIEALYGAGYFGPVVNVTVDGREAAGIPPFERPDAIGRVTVTVRPGPRFRFGSTSIAPTAPDTDLPEDFRPGAIARTGTLRATSGAAVDGWRALGFAKAEISGQDLRARHQESRLDAAIFVDPGPRLRFGRLSVSGNEAVKGDAVGRIIAWPRGEIVTPEAAERAAARLRRSGAFRSVALTEAELPNPDGTLDFDLRLVEEKRRRFGLGGEFSTEEGLRFTAFWLNRNLLGDAERLRFDGELAGIGGQTGGIDLKLGASFERPATFFVDTDFLVDLTYETLREPEFTSDSFEITTGLRRIVSDRLTAELGIGFRNSTIDDATGEDTFRLLTFPGMLTWSDRDDALDPKTGQYLEASLTPFLGLQTAGSGARLVLDGRIYRPLADTDRFVLAGSAQIGSILGPGIEDVPADFRFFTGGGGTVRGQSYQSLGVEIGGETTGGLGFLALSGEVRATVTETIGVVGFADLGFVGDSALPGTGGGSHAGAGLGLRYNTGLGPIRLDLAVPVSESNGSSFFVYVGIGQAF
ncbi:MAG: BamA/TamA family outer membrane protein [Pseudomonadota bacterium]